MGATRKRPQVGNIGSNDKKRQVENARADTDA